MLAGRSSEVRCGSCGAVVLLEDNVAMDRCPYCAAVLRNQPVAAQAMIPPESLLPFRVVAARGGAGVQSLGGRSVVCPVDLDAIGQPGAVVGSLCSVLDLRLDDLYPVLRRSRRRLYHSETYTATNAQGQSETHTRMVTHTDWYPASGQVKHFFDDVLVYASASLPRDKVDELEPWDLADLKSFDPAISGRLQDRTLYRGPGRRLSNRPSSEWTRRSGSSVARTSAATINSSTACRRSTSA